MLRIVIWNIYFGNLTDALYFLNKKLLVFITAVLFLLYIRTVLKNQACNIYMYHTYNRKLRVSNLRSSLLYPLCGNLRGKNIDRQWEDGGYWSSEQCPINSTCCQRHHSQPCQGNQSVMKPKSDCMGNSTKKSAENGKKICFLTFPADF